MGLFNRKKEEDLEDDEIDEEEPRRIRRQFRDLNPENRRSRKEPLKPWENRKACCFNSITSDSFNFRCFSFICT